MNMIVCLILAIAGSAIATAQSNTVQLRNGAHTTTIIAPTGGNYTLTLPAGAGTNGQALTTNGSGTLTWTSISGGATSIDGLSDAKSGGTNFTGSLMLGQEPASLGTNALQNTAVGIGALSSLTTGDNNVAVGYNALGSGTTAIEAVAIGYNALAAGSGAGRVVAVGPEAGSSCATCAYSVFVGRRAGAATNVVADNTVVGNDAFRMNTSGSDNTVIGANAMENQTSGNFNTAVGRWAGVSNTTGSGSVFLGYNAGPTAAAAVNNSLYIHNASSNTPLIKGDFAATTLTFNGSITTTGTSALNGNVTVGGGASASELRLLEPSGSGSNYSAFKAQAQTADLTYTLPSGITASGRFLKVMSPGTLSWEHIMPYRSVSASTSAGSSDNTLDVDASGGSVTISLNPSAGVNVEAGKLLIVRKLDASTNTVVIDPNLTETVNGAATYTLNRQYETVVIQSNGSDWIIVDSYTPVTSATITAVAGAATVDADLYSSVTVTGDGAAGVDIITISDGVNGQTITIFYDAVHVDDQPNVNGKNWGTAGSDVGLTCTKLGGTWRVVGVAAY